jgi:hypothetical protein
VRAEDAMMASVFSYPGCWLMMKKKKKSNKQLEGARVRGAVLAAVKLDQRWARFRQSEMINLFNTHSK